MRTHYVMVILFMSKEAVSSAGTDGPQSERRISFHSGDRRVSRRYRKPSGNRSRVGSGGNDLPKVNPRPRLIARSVYDAVFFTCKTQLVN